MYNVVIVDDHKIFRDGFKMAIDLIDNAKYMGEAANGDDLLKLLKTKVPDIIFVDVNMPVMNGYDTVMIALNEYPDLKFIALTSFNELDVIKNMIHAGVEGYMLKNSEISEIETAIRYVMSGKNYFDREVLEIMTKNVFQDIKKDHNDDSLIEISIREKEILQLLCSGLSVNEISESLNISSRTVEKHKENLMLKSQTKNTVNLVLWGLRNHVTEL